MIKKALVIAGGGAKGAFAGGVAEYLIKVKGNQYDFFVGTSSGNLLLPHLAIGAIDKIKKAMTEITQSEVFSSCPFLIRQKNGKYLTRINHFGILGMFLKGKKTFGDSQALLRFIEKVLDEEDYERCLSSETEIFSCVANLTLNDVEYKRLKDFNRKDYCRWMWASSNIVPFMSLFECDGYSYGDGGFGDLVPISKAIEEGACDIDVVLLQPFQQMIKKPPLQNALDVAVRVFDFMLDQVGNDDVKIGKLESQRDRVNLKFYRPAKELTSNSLLFIPDLQKSWWELGYEIAQKGPVRVSNLEKGEKILK